MVANVSIDLGANVSIDLGANVSIDLGANVSIDQGANVPIDLGANMSIDLVIGAPMSADVNLSSDDMRVECFLEWFEQERVANTSNCFVLSRIAGWVSDEQFLEVAGVDGPARSLVTRDSLKLVQSQNDIHIAEASSQPKTHLRQAPQAHTHAFEAVDMV